MAIRRGGKCAGFLARARAGARATFLPELPPGDARSRVAVFLTAVSFAIIVGVSFLLVLRAFEAKPTLVAALLGLLAASGASLLLVKRGAIRAATRVLLWSILVFIVFQATRTNGFHDSILLAVPGMTVIAGMLVGSLEFFLFSLAGLASVWTIILLELSGAVVNRFSDATEPADLVDFTVLFLITAVSVRMLSLGLLRSLERAKESEAGLRAGLAEKDVLLKEIHHRVKNNLQVVSSMLSLGTDEAEGRQAEVLRSMMERVHSMSLVHERLYLSEDFARIDFAQYLGAMVVHLRNSLSRPGIECRVEAEPVTLGIDDAVPAGLVMNELVSNAFKHAFPGRADGRILVTLREAGGEVSLGVRDDGAGMPPDGEGDRDSLGHVLVRSLVAQLRGVLRAEAAEGGGTAFTVTFPKRS